MAERPQGYGLTAETQKKLDSKYDVEKEQEARHWMEAVVGEQLSGAIGSEGFHQSLKNGVFLCKLINKLQTGSVRKINESKMAFKEMENIGNFLTACEKYGMNKVDMFQTVDLYEAQNMWQVVCGIHALGRAAMKKGFHGPHLGVKEADRNVRQFSEAQLKEGGSIIGLQMGSNKGASQAGLSFGKSRDILQHAANDR